MALDSFFNAMKKEGYILKSLDSYLLSLNSEDNDRAIDVNAPSQMGVCKRNRFYMRTQKNVKSSGVDARTRRIFDNGHYTHERLQNYLMKQGMLLMDEVPVLNEDYNIQGHTDGVLRLSLRSEELAILEIKSINSNGFSLLKSARDDHIMQGLIYAYCIEEHRKFLNENLEDEKEFKESEKIRKEVYESYYSHLKDGKKFSREEKIKFQVDLHLSLDDLLFGLKVPITKVIFLYENKDTQDLKEFCIESSTNENKKILKQLLKDCEFVNECVEKNILPEKEGKSKSDIICRYCNFKNECWG